MHARPVAITLAVTAAAASLALAGPALASPHAASVSTIPVTYVGLDRGNVRSALHTFLTAAAGSSSALTTWSAN